MDRADPGDRVDRLRGRGRGRQDVRRHPRPERARAARSRRCRATCPSTSSSTSPRSASATRSSSPTCPSVPGITYIGDPDTMLASVAQPKGPTAEEEAAEAEARRPRRPPRHARRGEDEAEGEGERGRGRGVALLPLPHTAYARGPARRRARQSGLALRRHASQPGLPGRGRAGRALARRPPEREKHGGALSEVRLEDGTTVALLRPLGFMNLSGGPVQKAVQRLRARARRRSSACTTTSRPRSGRCARSWAAAWAATTACARWPSGSARATSAACAAASAVQRRGRPARPRRLGALAVRARRGSGADGRARPPTASS